MTLAQKIETGLFKMAKAVSFVGYPVSWEKLEIDENRSLWASYTPDYLPNPPLKGDVRADMVIIGGGYTGISTAYQMSQRFPDKKIVLLEAKSLANGASGRNGGMMLNWVYGTGPLSAEMTRRVYMATNETIDEIERIIATHQLKVSYRRDGCMEVFTDEQRAREAEQEAAYLQGLGVPVQFVSATAVQQRINLQGIYGGFLDTNEGQLNGVQFIRGLRPVLEARGVAIYENTAVTKIIEGKVVEVVTEHGRVHAPAIVLATNGYTGKLGYFRKEYFPLHSHVFATPPLTPQQKEAMGWHSTAGFADDLNRISYATHTNEGHIVFGGGSNRSYDYLFNNRTACPSPPSAAFTAMHQTMSDYLPASAGLPHAHRWTGTLAITLRRNCAIGVRGAHGNVYYALGYSGHGVTAANMAGRILTDIYSDHHEPWQEFNFVQTRPDQPSHLAPIPLEPFRWLGYQMTTRLTGRSPREAHG
jgi:gamma-glutamylputrescine oxidase